MNQPSEQIQEMKLNRPICDKCGRTFSRANISPTSPTCEDCLIDQLEQYPMAHGVRRR